MTARQALAARGLQGAGVLALAAVGALLALELAGRPVLEGGMDLRKMLAALAGLALLLRGNELASAQGWSPVAAWLAAPAEARRETLVRYGALGLELALIYLLIRNFEIENVAFWSLLAPLIVAGAVLHHVVPRAHRHAFFVLLCFGAIHLAFGFQDACWLVALGIGIAGLCYLPVALSWRVALIVAFAALLAAARMDLFPVPWSRAIWPILGSMFMFRTIVCLYDLRHQKAPATWSERLGYFFLLPNVSFPLFPVVDFAAYRRTHYDVEAYRIYQRGIEWMWRGILQLILYRLVYQYLTIPQEEVRTWGDTARFMVANFLLYVRVSGQFHLIVGSLHLFGFHLPETHRRPFLASSFTDFWRRINIYWKDFMMKVFYYPLHFRLRKYGERTAMVVATLVVFAMTWALHSYQWFWLLGSFPVTTTDIVFWGVLAVLLVANALREQRVGRSRSLKAKSLDARGLATRVLATAATFTAICVLWSVWMSPTFGDWLSLWAVRGFAPSGSLGGPAVALVAAALVAAMLVPLSGSSGGLREASGQSAFVRSALLTSGLMVLLFAFGRPHVYENLGAGAARVMASLRTSELNARDLTQIHRGYYEDLMGVSRFNSQLWEVYMRKPPAAAWPRLEETPAARFTGDFLRSELVPGVRINFLGSTFSVNRWGMRDQDYEQAKPRGTGRIALMGASVEMGWGVGDGEPFEQVLETRLARGARSGADRVEILNFAVGSHTMPQQLLAVDRVLAFEPDVVLVAAHEIDARESVNRILERARNGVSVPIEMLASAAREAGLGSSPEPVVRKRLEGVQLELLETMYRELASRLRARGVLPVWVFVPTPDRAPSDQVPALEAAARRAGFETVSLADAYRGHDLASLQLTRFDYHPNAQGHRLLAERLGSAFAEQPQILRHRAPPATR